MTNFETTFIVEMILNDVAWEKVDHRAGFRDAMSASGYKQTFQGVSQNVHFTPESGHSNREIPTLLFGCPLLPQKQT